MKRLPLRRDPLQRLYHLPLRHEPTRENHVRHHRIGARALVQRRQRLEPPFLERDARERPVAVLGERLFPALGRPLPVCPGRVGAGDDAVREGGEGEGRDGGWCRRGAARGVGGGELFAVD